MKYLCIIFLALFLAATSALAATGTSLNVPIGHPTYGYIDKLIASGLVKSSIYGQRPWTRLYVAKMVKEAVSNKHKLSDPLENEKDVEKYNKKFSHKRFIDEILDILADEYSFELKEVVSRQPSAVGFTDDRRPTTDDSSDRRPTADGYINIHPLSSLSTTYTYLNNSQSPVPQNGLGSIDAVTHPLVANREGRQYEKGHHFYWETEHSAQISQYFAAYAKPQFQFRFPSSPSPSVGGGQGEGAYTYIQNLYVKTGWQNIELQIGRENMLWGQGLHGGLLFSDNPRGLDSIKITTPYPLRLPWIFKHLGNFKWQGFLGNLGPEYTRKNAWIMGWELTWQPWYWWEFGGESVVVFGGEGGAFLSPWAFWRNFTLVPYSASGSQNTNRLLGLNSKWTIPQWRGFQIYGEVIFEDHTDTWSMVFGHDSAWQLGFYMPRLDHSGKWSARVEYERPNDRLYHHAAYTSGWALNKQLLGAISGPDSDHATSTISYYFTPSTKLEGNFSFLHRSSNTYNVVGENKDVNRAYDGPEEYHALNIYTFEFPLYNAKTPTRQHANTFFRTSFGWDYVINKDFIQGRKKADFLGEISLTMKFPQF